MKIEKLIERVKAGDADALKTVYETYSQRMRNVCIGITQEDEDTVSDLVQEAFIRAYYSLGKLKDSSKFGEWIVAITKNVHSMFLRKKNLKFFCCSFEKNVLLRMCIQQQMRMFSMSH